MTYKFKLSRRLAASHSRRLGAMLGLVATLSACGASSPTGTDTGGGTPVVTPGWLTVQLTSPYQDDGAIQLRISGPSIDSITPAESFDGFGAVTAGVADLVVTGSVATGNVARFLVADVNRSAQYAVSVVAVAQQSTFALRPNTALYDAVIVR